MVFISAKVLPSLMKEMQDASDNPAELALLEQKFAEEIEDLQHIFVGPTWQRTALNKWYLPELTLGWQIAGWCTEYLRAEDGSPWKFTKEQLRFILWWYAIDARGVFLYQSGCLQRLKGWGKDPLLAVMCLVEFVGPCRFSHMENGQPVAVAHPASWVQIAAVSREQTSNTTALFPSLMSKELVATYDISPGLELTRAANGRQKLEAVTSSYRSLEGKRSTFVVLNETHHWVLGNQGHKMFETVDGNVTKAKGGAARYLAITNAYIPGEDSVAERMRIAFDKIAEGKAADVGMLYDSVEAHPSTPLHPIALRIVIPKIRGDAWWLNEETIIRSIQNTAIPPSDSRRKWLNQIVAEEDALYSPPQWDALECDLYLQANEKIVLGFDGGKTDDSTALVAIRCSDMLAVPLGIWEKPDTADYWEINRDQVNSAVHQAFRQYNVVGFYADVALWESYIADWNMLYSEQLLVRATESRDAIAWDMRTSLQRSTRANERLMQSILDEKLKWSISNNEPLAVRLRRHVLNTYRSSNNHGLSFRKQSRESTRKVDAYAALMLAHEALHDYRIRGKTQVEHTGEVWMWR